MLWLSVPFPPPPLRIRTFHRGRSTGANILPLSPSPQILHNSYTRVNPSENARARESVTSSRANPDVLRSVPSQEGTFSLCSRYCCLLFVLSAFNVLVFCVVNHFPPSLACFDRARNVPPEPVPPLDQVSGPRRKRSASVTKKYPFLVRSCQVKRRRRANRENVTQITRTEKQEENCTHTRAHPDP